MKQEKLEAYADMLALPHPEPRSRQRMPLANRAAQFAPFDALTGYGALITETARETEEEAELDESQREQLDQCLSRLLRAGTAGPEVTITWFVPDDRKNGGAYQTIRGQVRGYAASSERLLLADGTAIPVNRIRSIDGAEELETEPPADFMFP